MVGQKRAQVRQSSFVCHRLILSHLPFCICQCFLRPHCFNRTYTFVVYFFISFFPSGSVRLFPLKVPILSTSLFPSTIFALSTVLYYYFIGFKSLYNCEILKSDNHCRCIQSFDSKHTPIPHCVTCQRIQCGHNVNAYIE